MGIINLPVVVSTHEALDHVLTSQINAVVLDRALYPELEKILPRMRKAGYRFSGRQDLFGLLFIRPFMTDMR